MKNNSKLYDAIVLKKMNNILIVEADNNENMRFIVKEKCKSKLDQVQVGDCVDIFYTHTHETNWIISLEINNYKIPTDEEYRKLQERIKNI